MDVYRNFWEYLMNISRLLCEKFEELFEEILVIFKLKSSIIFKESVGGIDNKQFIT